MFLKKSNKQQQSGRSMVEMLGVLAIIGVLSIGGIAGYTLSMRRYRANQVIDALNKYALIVYGACQKALLDGDLSTIGGCNSRGDIAPLYADSGLAPIGDIYIGSARMYDNKPNEVFINASFQDLEICKAAKSIIGSKDEYSCTGQGSQPTRMYFNFKFN